MKYCPRLSHVALLVRSVERSAAVMKVRGFPVGPTEIWDGEGTREIYVGDKSSSGLLLLMEPIREGAYSRAIKKRGPGLHHIAIDVLDLENYIADLSGTGWFLLPKSIESIRTGRTAWLARPGVEVLIEVHGRDSLPDTVPFISKIAVPSSGDFSRLFPALGLAESIGVSGNGMQIHIPGAEISIRELLAETEETPAEIVGADHFQVTIPKGEEARAREFYVDFLGLSEIPKPASLQGRGGFWLRAGAIQVHVGGEDGVDRTKTKVHVAYRVRGLDSWRTKLLGRGITPLESIPIEGVDRFEFRDPFGNRVEFLERK